MRAEGHADADFATTLDDGAGEDAVEAGGDESEGEERESAGDAGEKTLAAEIVIDDLVEGVDFGRLGSGKNARGGALDGRGCEALVTGTDCEEGRDESVFFLLDEVIEDKGSGFQQALHAGVFSDADDAIRRGRGRGARSGFGRRAVSCGDEAADGILTGKKKLAAARLMTQTLSPAMSLRVKPRPSRIVVPTVGK